MKNLIAKIHRNFGVDFVVGPFTQKEAEVFLTELGFEKSMDDRWHLTNWGSATIGEPMPPEVFKKMMPRI